MGSYYGAKLARTGHEVHFLLRSDFDAVREHGILIHSPDGDFRVQPHAANDPAQIGPCDLVLIGLKTTANSQFSRLLPPLVGPHTAVLTLQNGLGNEEQLAELFPAEQILGGLCFVCLNRIAPGIIQHIDYGFVMLGEFQRPPLPRTRQIATAFQTAGVQCKVAENLARAHWEKLTWNIPFNGLGVASAAGLEAVLSGATDAVPRHPCLTTDRLLANPEWTRLVRELILEVVAAANARQFDLSPSLADTQIQRTQSMGPYKASTLIDFERGLPLELDSLFLEPLRQARAAGASTPRLAALCRVLEALDPANRQPA